MTKNPILLVVAAALLDKDSRILIGQRRNEGHFSGLWEFPGGKLEEGETPEQGIIRELQEELDIKLTLPCLTPFVFASHGYETFHLLMPLYLVRQWKGKIKAKTHQNLSWVRAEALLDYPMPPADITLCHWLMKGISTLKGL